MIDHGEARGPYETSPEAQALADWQIEHRVIYRGHDKGLGIDRWNPRSRGYDPAYEPGTGMDTGIFGGWTLS